MRIVDAQVHIWAASTVDHPWPAGRNPPHRSSPFGASDALREMDAAGVSRAVLVTPSWQGEFNEVTLAAARAHPDRFAVVGRFDHEAPEARGQIATWLKQSGMVGLRLTFNIQGDEKDDWVWAEAEKAAVPIMISAPQLHLIERVAARHPGLRFVLDPPLNKGKKDDQAFADFDGLVALAKRSNIAVKAKALPNLTTEDYPYRNMQPYIRRWYDAYGPKRMFWGTDLTGLRGSYRQSITMLTEEIPWLTAEDKEWIMGRGVCEWMGWPFNNG